jgi:methionyl-tRNA synthetase
VWALISAVDKYIVQKAPRGSWRARPTRLRSRAERHALHRRREPAHRHRAAQPVLPQSAPKIWAQLGMPEPIESVRFETLQWGGLQPGQKIGEVAAVFPRIDLKEAVAPCAR